MSHIIVLDGYTINPGDLDWSAFETLGDVTVYDRTTPEEVWDRIAGAEIVLTNKVPIREEHLGRATRLRYIGVLATGYDVVDVAAAARRSIVVSNVPAYGTSSVAQFTFGLILELAHRIGHHSITVHAGRWAVNPDWCYWDYPTVELDGRTLGVVGYGRIGSRVAALGKAFGMRVLVNTPPPRPADQPPDAFVDLETLFSQSDIVTLHCPLTPDTRGMVSAQRLARMKPTAWLINASRGPLVDEDALAHAIRGKQIAGAALDVLSKEPPPPDHPLMGLPNCIITPHMAWATLEARRRLIRIAEGNLRAFLEGRPRNVVH